MRLTFAIFLFVFSSNSLASNKISIFGEDIQLPESCKMIVRSSDDISYYCWSQDSRYQSINFLSPKKQSDKLKELSNLPVESDISVISISSKIIGKREHYLVQLMMDSSESFDYSICETELCISVLSGDIRFISEVIGQLSPPVLLNGEDFGL